MAVSERGRDYMRRIGEAKAASHGAIRARSAAHPEHFEAVEQGLLLPAPATP
jgi:hypothetical protein